MRDVPRPRSRLTPRGRADLGRCGRVATRRAARARQPISALRTLPISSGRNRLLGRAARRRRFVGTLLRGRPGGLLLGRCLLLTLGPAAPLATAAFAAVASTPASAPPTTTPAAALRLLALRLLLLLLLPALAPALAPLTTAATATATTATTSPLTATAATATATVAATTTAVPHAPVAHRRGPRARLFDRLAILLAHLRQAFVLSARSPLAIAPKLLGELALVSVVEQPAHRLAAVVAADVLSLLGPTIEGDFLAAHRAREGDRPAIPLARRPRGLDAEPSVGARPERHRVLGFVVPDSRLVVAGFVPAGFVSTAMPSAATAAPSISWALAQAALRLPGGSKPGRRTATQECAHRFGERFALWPPPGTGAVQTTVEG